MHVCRITAVLGQNASQFQTKMKGSLFYLCVHVYNTQYMNWHTLLFVFHFLIMCFHFSVISFESSTQS